LFPLASAFLEAPDGVHRGENVQRSVHQTKSSSSSLGLVFDDVVLPVRDVDYEIQRAGQVQEGCNDVVRSLEERLRHDGGRRDGAEAREEQQGRGDERRRGHQQEEQLRHQVLGVARPRPRDVVADDADGDTPDHNLEYLEDPRKGFDVSHVDEHS